jgi:iron complex outermembrane recepter protein
MQNASVGRRLGRARVFPLSGALAVSISAATYAQTPPTAAAASEPIEEVTVTGSHLIRHEDTATSPLVTISQDVLQEQGGGTFGIKLQQLPQVTAGANELTGSGQPTGRATIDLRGLGSNRTLVLADGRRLQPSTAAVEVDLNTIPAALIDNVEVITGGASAVYGSDAVAGVVNLKLKHHFQGFELDGQFNSTELGDGQEETLDALMGTNFADNRGNIVLSIDYLSRGRAYFDNRPFYQAAFPIGAAPWGSNLLPQGGFVPDATNLPSQAAMNSVFGGYGVANGAVAPGSVLSFNPDGSLFGQVGAVNYRGPLNNDYVVSKTQSALVYNLGPLQLLSSPTTRWSTFSHGEFKLNDDVTLYGQAMFTKYDAITNYGAGLQTQGTTAVVPVDNAFIPTDLATILASRANPTVPFSMQKLWLQTGTSVSTYDNTVYQFVGGAKGSLPFNDWTWDAYGTQGSTAIDVTQTSGGASFSRIQQLLTSRSVAGPNGTLVNVPAYIAAGGGGNTLIANPAYATAINDGGRSIPGLNGGPNPCPNGLNIFSSASLDPSCRAYLQIHPTNRTSIDQTVIELDLQGTAVELPAGKLQLAAGADYRKNTYHYNPDPATTDEVGSFPAASVSGSTDVKEVYLEGLVPLVKNVFLAKSLDLDAAYRRSNYLSGAVNAYKLDLDWKMVDSLRIRGGYERAIRAPNVVELYNPSVAAPALLGQQDPCNVGSAQRTGASAAQVRALCIAQGVPNSIIDSYESTFAGTQAIQQGNTQLKPEIANTFTAGVVWQAMFAAPLAQGLSLSADYFNIDLQQAISTLSADLVFQRCFSSTYNPTFSQNNSYCQSIIRTAGVGTPDQTVTPYFNLGGLKTTGVDFELRWGPGLGALGLSDRFGKLDLDMLATRLQHFEVQASQGAPWAEYVGTIGYGATGDNGAHPRWKANTTLAWENGGAQVGVRWYFVQQMQDIFGGPGVANYSTFDLFGRLKVTHVLQLQAGINNLANKEPLATFGGLPGNTDSGTYDPLGRRYFVSFSAKF